MYKIMLFDRNGVGFCSGVASFFTEDLESFEKHWLDLEDDEDTKERYLKSKAGEIVTDYYSDDPSLNIVQQDPNCQILAEKKFVYHQKEWMLYNSYNCGSQYYADEVEIDLRHIKHQEQNFLIGKYKLTGVYTKDFFAADAYTVCNIWGNPVLIQTTSEETRDACRGRNIVMDKAVFRNEKIETYCWVTVGIYDSPEEMNLAELTDIPDELMERLMFDIPGEAG
ncbi:hypothetical protein [Chakrabartyella piscis]|uniref:hypothetical protein n=1 Tax=Chakrabartyella piscis TaxID=2918914 RepID=UPI0029588255|nr:hypothetical protein [Chakrabartyella piscis]